MVSDHQLDTLAPEPLNRAEKVCTLEKRQPALNEERSTQLIRSRSAEHSGAPGGDSVADVKKEGDGAERVPGCFETQNFGITETDDVSVVNVAVGCEATLQVGEIRLVQIGFGGAERKQQGRSSSVIPMPVRM